MDNLGLEFASALGIGPVQLVKLAAKLGCRHISTMLRGPHVNPYGESPFDFGSDHAAREDMVAAMRDLDVSISLGEGFLVTAGGDVRTFEKDLAIMQALGARRVNVVSMDPDLARTFDEFALFADLACQAGIPETVSEFAPVLTVPDLATALAAKRHVGRTDFRLLIDTMHFARTGGTADELISLDSDVIGYIQLCDVPVVATVADYMEEAMCQRLAPGDGELPLAQLLAAMPMDRIVSLEVPQMAKALAGQNLEDILRPIIAAGWRVMNDSRVHRKKFGV